MASNGFVHLHTHSEFSLLDGAARLDGLVKQAVALDMPALAITDHGVMYGAVDFYNKCKAAGIKPIVGVEAYVAPESHLLKARTSEKNAYHLLLLARDFQGYKNLMKLTTIAAVDGFYSKPRIDHELFAKHKEGIIATSACLGGEVCSALMKNDYKKARDIAGWYRDLLGADNYYIELQDHTLPQQRECNAYLLQIAKELGLDIICTNDVHYLTGDDAYAHDVLLCIGTGATVNDPKRLKYGAEEFYMKSAAQMYDIFKEHPEAVENTLKIMERCNLEMEFGRAPMPSPGIPTAHTPQTYLRELAYQGLARKIGPDAPRYRDRLDYELSVVEQTGFAQYFLIVRDFALFARDKGIFFGVRGSAAGSLTSFCIDITDIDPVDYDLTFERFLNPERVQMPDIDMDFEDARRGEVIEYVTQKYGKDHVAQIITFGTMAAKAALKDAGRALAMPIPEVNRVAAMIPTLPLGMTIQKSLDQSPEFKGMYNNEPETRKLIDTAQRLEGLSRHASVHAAGVIISHEPLVEYTPLQKSNEGGYVTQYPAGALEKIGLLKMDFLGLINLSILGRTVENIQRTTGEVIDVRKIPFDDKRAFDLLGKGDTTGIFQLESEGMRRNIIELKPTSVRDLAAMVALYRPGPMAHIPTFIRAKHGLEKIHYLHPKLKPILEETYGVIVYQDQVMRIAQAIAGYTLGQADILRRAMGKKKKEEMAKERQNFLNGAESQDIPAKAANEIFDHIEPFAGYAFNKAHAVCYAVVAYQTAYLKANYPVEYMAALLTCYIEKTDKVATCLEECRRLELPVLPPDINLSDVDFTPEGRAIRFGLAGIKNVGRAAVDLILESRREGGEFTTLADFCTRTQNQTGVTRSTIESLIQAGAFHRIHPNRKALVEALDGALQAASRDRKAKEAGQGDLFGEIIADEPEVQTFSVPNVRDYDSEELLKFEKDLLGVYISDHPLQKYGDTIRKQAPLTIEQVREMNNNDQVVLGGIITTVKPHISKTSKERMAFFTLEDLTGQNIAVTIFPKSFAECGQNIEKDRIVMLRGKISSRDRMVREEDESTSRTVEILADDVVPVAAPQNANGTAVGSRALNIRLKRSHEGVLRPLRSAFEEHRGETPVYLHIECVEPVRRVSVPFRVAANDALLGLLEGLVGKSAVWLA